MGAAGHRWRGPAVVVVVALAALGAAARKDAPRSHAERAATTTPPDTKNLVEHSYTQSTLDAALDGRAVLLQFTLRSRRACPACANATLDAKWARLAEAFKGSTEVLVGVVACDGGEDAEALCDEALDALEALDAVVTYPAVRYGDRHVLRTYYGGRSEAALAALAASLRAPCSAQRRDRCSDDELRKLAAYEAMDPRDLDSLVTTETVRARSVAERLEKEAAERRDDVVRRLDEYHAVAAAEADRIVATIDLARDVAKERGFDDLAAPYSVLEEEDDDDAAYDEYDDADEDLAAAYAYGDADPSDYYDDEYGDTERNGVFARPDATYSDDLLAAAAGYYDAEEDLAYYADADGDVVEAYRDGHGYDPADGYGEGSAQDADDGGRRHHRRRDDDVAGGFDYADEEDGWSDFDFGAEDALDDDPYLDGDYYAGPGGPYADEGGEILGAYNY